MSQGKLAGGAAGRSRRLLQIHIIKQTTLSMIINSAISVAFALLHVRGRSSVPLLGAGGMAFDFIPQVFMITFATVLAVSLATSREMKREVLVSASPRARNLLSRLPGNLFVRALICALGATLAVSSMATFILALAGLSHVDAALFVFGKAALGAVLSLVLAPAAAKAALTS
jgi:hypothetical protein